MTVQPSPGDKAPDAPSPPPDRPADLIGLLSEVSRTREQTDNFISIVDNIKKFVEPWARACFLLAVAASFLLVCGVATAIFLAVKGIHGAGAPWALASGGLTTTCVGTPVLVRFYRRIRRRRIRRRHAHRASARVKPKPQIPPQNRRQAPR
jgi:hypothetical protein